MTKRLFGVIKGHREHIADHTGRLYSDGEVADLLNTVYEENEQLKSSDTITDLETEIMNLKAILNDFINILNRLQSNPNNEQTLNVARDMLQNMGKELEE